MSICYVRFVSLKPDTIYTQIGEKCEEDLMHYMFSFHKTPFLAHSFLVVNIFRSHSYNERIIEISLVQSGWEDTFQRL